MNRCLKLWSFGLVVAGLALPAVAQNNGEQIYKARCAMCHGQDGLAATPVAKMMAVPSFRDPAVMKTPTAQLVEITKNGKGKMPAFNGKLTAAEVDQVVAYIHRLQH